MPANGVNNFCATLAPSGAVYLMDLRRTWRFDPGTQQFTRLANNPVRMSRRACGAVGASDGSDDFVVVGGTV